MRAAVAQRHAEALRAADRDVGAELARRREQREREQIGRHGDQRAGVVRALGQVAASRGSAPSVAGYCSEHAEDVGRRRSRTPSASPTTHLDAERPRRACAPPRSSAGGSPSDTRKPARRGSSSLGAGASACSMCIASAAAVASSSSEALATGSPVRSATIVWKLSSASSRPCEISAW